MSVFGKFDCVVSMTLAAVAMACPAASWASTPGNSDAGLTVLQWNIWQEGSVVEGGYDAIVDEIVRLKPDFVTFSEVRNYNDTRFDRRIVESLASRGLTYYSFTAYDSGILSRHPIVESKNLFEWKPETDCGSIYKVTAVVNGRPTAVYTAHLDYRNCAYYDVRGYDGSTWAKTDPLTSVDEVMARNVASQRDDAIKIFIDEARRDSVAGYDIILGGDFNEPSHRDWTPATASMFDHNGLVVPWTVSSLLTGAGFHDTYREIYPDPVTHPGITYPADNPDVAIEKLTWAPLADERERIDFVYYKSNRLKVREASIFGPASSVARGVRTPDNTADPRIEPLGVWPTDHKGVLVTFETAD